MESGWERFVVASWGCSVDEGWVVAQVGEKWRQERRCGVRKGRAEIRDRSEFVDAAFEDN